MGNDALEQILIVGGDEIMLDNASIRHYTCTVYRTTMEDKR